MKIRDSNYLNWKSTLVKSDCKLKAVIKKLNKTALQIVLVVGKNKKLIGTITDGDVRRGLLSGLTTGDKINSIINKNPITINFKDDSNLIKKKMLKFGVRQIPMVNNKKQVINLFVLDKPNLSNKIENRISFMVGGKGKRLMPLTKKIPKPMLKIKGVPILDILFEKSKSEGFHNIIFLIW